MPDKMQTPDGWVRTTLRGQLAVCRNGFVCQQDADPSNAIPVTRIETISEGKINWTRVGYVSPEDANREYLLRRGDILLSHINSVKHIGKVARKTDDRPLVHGMNLMALRCGEHLDPGFGFAVMASHRTKTYMERRAKKAVNQASINRQDIFALPILLPPLPEQRAIAAVLDSIDEAIERTEAVIAATERLRDALLHELLTRGVPGWHTQWKDVPGLGTIPADWEVVRLGDECKRITKGTTPTTLGRQYTSLGVRFIRVENVSDDGVISGGETRFINQDTHILLSRSVLKENDLILSIAGALGRSALIMEDVLPANVNQALAIIRLAQGSRILPGFLSFVFRGKPMQLQVNPESTDGQGWTA